jgi:hypothetical protein
LERGEENLINGFSEPLKIAEDTHGLLYGDTRARSATFQGLDRRQGASYLDNVQYVGTEYAKEVFFYNKGKAVYDYSTNPNLDTGRALQDQGFQAGFELLGARTALRNGSSVPRNAVPGRFEQLREAAEFLRDDAGISNRAYRRQVIESFGDDLRVEVYQGQGFQYSGSAGPISRYPTTQSRYLSTRIVDDPIQELALPSRFNSATLLQEFEVLPTRALRGTVSPQQFSGGPYLRGGAEQIFVPNVSVLRGGNIVPIQSP